MAQHQWDPPFPTATSSVPALLEQGIPTSPALPNPPALALSQDADQAGHQAGMWRSL